MKPSKTPSIIEDGQKLTWNIEKLWKRSSSLQVFEYIVSEFDGLDEDFLFGSKNKPTVRSVLEHCEKIKSADFSYPIIISESGVIMDGLHRICRAILDGKETLPAVRFEKNPAPDHIEDLV